MNALRTTLLVTAVGLGLALLPATATAKSPPASAPAAATETPAVDPRVTAGLDAMGKYLRTLKEFSVRADTAADYVAEDNQTFQLAGVVEYQATLPSGLHARITTDRKDREFFYDGKTLTVYSPRMKYYATVPAPPTLRELVIKAENELGVVLPLSDLFLWGTDDAGRVPMTSAVYVGPTKIGGEELDHYAIRQGAVDWQVWIAKGDKPLPRRLVLTANDDPARPSYAANLSWNLSAKNSSSAFVFTPPKDAMKIAFEPAPAVADGNP